MEDNPFLTPGEYARTNAELVEKSCGSPRISAARSPRRRSPEDRQDPEERYALKTASGPVAHEGGGPQGLRHPACRSRRSTIPARARRRVSPVKACGIDGTDLKLLRRLWLHAGTAIHNGARAGGHRRVCRGAREAIAPGDRVIPYNFLIPPRESVVQASASSSVPRCSASSASRDIRRLCGEALALPAHQLVRIPDGIAMA